MTHHVDHATITLAKGSHSVADSCGAAARDAAGDLLAPTVAELQTSAIALYDRMITP